MVHATRSRRHLSLSRSLRIEPLEYRTLMSATPVSTQELAASLPAAEAETELVADTSAEEARTTDTTDFKRLADRIGPVTKEEYLLLIGRSGGDLMQTMDDYGGYGGGYGSSAPTTTGIPDVTVDEDADPVWITLTNYFDDEEDSSDELDYWVESNSAPSVVDAYCGGSDLQLSFLANAFGAADITVSATDSDSNMIETTFTVNVNAVNDPPVITGFYAYNEYGDFWTFNGTVTDVDGPVDGLSVTFGGVASGSTSVGSDGTFSYTASFPNMQPGTATAQTQDGEGASSNLAMYEIV